jgi:hypothetical protein
MVLHLTSSWKYPGYKYNQLLSGSKPLSSLKGKEMSDIKQKIQDFILKNGTPDDVYLGSESDLEYIKNIPELSPKRINPPIVNAERYKPGVITLRYNRANYEFDNSVPVKEVKIKKEIS